MSASDNLESLDDKTLRAKCLEYGLPNVPITATSKKIIIKKLRSVMDKKTTTKDNTKSARRETIQVSTTASNQTEKDANKKTNSNNRRATTSNVHEATPIKNAGNPAVISNRRRSGRSTPVMQESNTPIKNKHVEPMIIEETDFDEDFILIEDDDSINRPSPLKNIFNRKSQSPTLSKSVVTSTSYAKSGSIPKTIPENDHAINYMYKSAAAMPKMPYQANYEPKGLSSNRNTLDHQTLSALYNQPSIVLTRTSHERENYPTGYKSIYPNLNAAVNEASNPVYYDAAATSHTNRRYTTSGYKQPNVYRTSKYMENSDSNEQDDDDGVDDDDDDDGNTPYLSDFARRLSRLKAEPLDIGLKNELLQRQDTNYSSPVGRRSYSNNKNDGTLGESFLNFFYALDHKYKLRRNIFLLCLLSAIILAVYYSI